MLGEQVGAKATLHQLPKDAIDGSNTRQWHIEAGKLPLQAIWHVVLATACRPAAVAAAALASLTLQHAGGKTWNFQLFMHQGTAFIHGCMLHRLRAHPVDLADDLSAVGGSSAI
jgi:hypothetical protein